MSDQVPSAIQVAWARGLMTRRTAMAGMAGVSGLAALAACGSAGKSSTAGATTKNLAKVAPDQSATEKLVSWSNWPEYIDVDDNQRYEVKLTGTVAPNHTLSATYLDNETTQTRPAFDTSIDPRVIVTRTLPNRLFVTNYNGVLTAKLFVEAQFSEKKFGNR